MRSESTKLRRFTCSREKHLHTTSSPLQLPPLYPSHLRPHPRRPNSNPLSYSATDSSRPTRSNFTCSNGGGTSFRKACGARGGRSHAHNASRACAHKWLHGPHLRHISVLPSAKGSTGVEQSRHSRWHCTRGATRRLPHQPDLLRTARRAQQEFLHLPIIPNQPCLFQRVANAIAVHLPGTLRHQQRTFSFASREQQEEESFIS